MVYSNIQSEFQELNVDPLGIREKLLQYERGPKKYKTQYRMLKFEVEQMCMLNKQVLWNEVKVNVLSL